MGIPFSRASCFHAGKPCWMCHPAHSELINFAKLALVSSFLPLLQFRRCCFPRSFNVRFAHEGRGGLEDPGGFTSCAGARGALIYSPISIDMEIERAAKFGAFFLFLSRAIRWIAVPLSVHPIFLCGILPWIRDERQMPLAVCASGADEAVARMSGRAVASR